MIVKWVLYKDYILILLVYPSTGSIHHSVTGCFLLQWYFRTCISSRVARKTVHWKPRDIYVHKRINGTRYIEENALHKFERCNKSRLYYALVIIFECIYKFMFWFTSAHVLERQVSCRHCSSSVACNVTSVARCGDFESWTIHIHIFRSSPVTVVLVTISNLKSQSRSWR